MPMATVPGTAGTRPTSLRRFGQKVKRHLMPDTRSRQLRDEVKFWRSWFSTRGLEWPADYEERLDPQLPIQDHLLKYVDMMPNAAVHILDVGAGPLTKIGKVHDRKLIIITATDLLAAQYARLLKEFGINPLVRTIFSDAEKLVDQFGENRFDIVHAQNSVDHTSDPFRVIRQMISVTKPGGFVVLLHAENEGEHEAYNQLHKWDFTCENGNFIIRGPGPHGNTVDVTNLLASLGSTECSMYDGDVLVGIKKHPL